MNGRTERGRKNDGWDASAIQSSDDVRTRPSVVTSFARSYAAGVISRPSTHSSLKGLLSSSSSMREGKLQLTRSPLILFSASHAAALDGINNAVGFLRLVSSSLFLFSSWFMGALVRPPNFCQVHLVRAARGRPNGIGIFISSFTAVGIEWGRARPSVRPILLP